VAIATETNIGISLSKKSAQKRESGKAKMARNKAKTGAAQQALSAARQSWRRRGETSNIKSINKALWRRCAASRSGVKAALSSYLQPKRLAVANDVYRRPVVYYYSYEENDV